jgi:hypothetical protein
MKPMLAFQKKGTNVSGNSFIISRVVLPGENILPAKENTVGSNHCRLSIGNTSFSFQKIFIILKCYSMKFCAAEFSGRHIEFEFITGILYNNRGITMNSTAKAHQFINGK